MIEYYDNIEKHRVVSQVQPGYLKPLLPEDAPNEPQPWADIEADIDSKIMPGITHWYALHLHSFPLIPATSR